VRSRTFTPASAFSIDLSPGVTRLSLRLALTR
jgi:hypothetical protein